MKLMADEAELFFERERNRLEREYARDHNQRFGIGHPSAKPKRPSYEQRVRMKLKGTSR
ncbi:TPA: hypothetical protein QDC51_001458 [Burkholderia multivorans]|nr:hypothetical protein [Burkholderia multivorans]HDR9840816.1 hypothetical protein [Burkholderia multivorans]HDR9847338.1 hypothetical protein [Burkholderia multivorans]HDR9853752.1 hypothetical protein [Burkholderia multivorans]